MKLRALLFYILVFSLALSGCQKDIDFVPGSGPGGNGATSKKFLMSAKIDGKLLNCSSVAAQQVDALGVLVIAGSSATENISITIADYNGAKVYDIETNSVLASYIKNSGMDPDKDFYIGIKGTVTITAVTDKLVSGTFSFNGGNLDVSNQKFVNVTEGTFTATLTKQ